MYLVSQEMPLFENQTLHLSTVLATWLVLNHRYLLSDATEEMFHEGKFGFHDIAHESLHLYEKENQNGFNKHFNSMRYKNFVGLQN